MYKRINLQFFADGGDGGVTGQGSSAGVGNGSQVTDVGGNSAGATFSFEQADEIASARAIRAEQAALRSYFQQQGMSEDEVKTALNEFKANKEKQKPNVSAIEQERDNALKELESMKNSSLLQKKGVRADDVDYVLFKVGKIVTDKVTFEQAVDKFLKENPRYKDGGTYRVATSTNTGGSTPAATGNESVNNMIRGAFGRK